MTDMACEICGEKVTNWSARFEADTVHCKKCFQTPEAKQFINEKYADTSPKELSGTENSIPDQNSMGYSFLSLLLFILAGLSLLCGLVICAQMWPGTAAATFLAVGVVQFALFSALGQGLHYLRQIASNKNS